MFTPSRLVSNLCMRKKKTKGQNGKTPLHPMTWYYITNTLKSTFSVSVVQGLHSEPFNIQLKYLLTMLSPLSGRNPANWRKGLIGKPGAVHLFPSNISSTCSVEEMENLQANSKQWAHKDISQQQSFFRIDRIIYNTPTHTTQSIVNASNRAAAPHHFQCFSETRADYSFSTSTF